MMRSLWLFLATSLLLAITACQPANVSPTPGLYLPPTLVASPRPLEVPTATPPPPTSPPRCTNSLRYLQDITIPDGSQVSPGEILDKRWLVENNGTCGWDQTYTLRLITGPSMQAPEIQPLYPALSGRTFNLTITYTAPNEPGIYRSAWQAYGPDEQPFGDPVFIEIVVTTEDTQP